MDRDRRDRVSILLSILSNAICTVVESDEGWGPALDKALFDHELQLVDREYFQKIYDKANQECPDEQSGSGLYKLDGREIDTIVTGLRLVQDINNHPALEILDAAGQFEPLSGREINDLCMRLYRGKT